MTDATRILSAIEQGDCSAAEQLLPLIYNELRSLAAHKMAREAPGQTLQATALVHEAYVRLVDTEKAQHWESRGHFFAAAAEAMRRILVENARRKHRLRHGGGYVRQEFQDSDAVAPEESLRLLALDKALDKLAAEDPKVAELVQLRYFGGLTIKQASEVLCVSPRTVNNYWTYAKAWLRKEMEGGQPSHKEV